MSAAPTKKPMLDALGQSRGRAMAPSIGKRSDGWASRKRMAESETESVSASKTNHACGSPLTTGPSSYASSSGNLAAYASVMSSAPRKHMLPTNAVYATWRVDGKKLIAMTRHVTSSLYDKKHTPSSYSSLSSVAHVTMYTAPPPKPLMKTATARAICFSPHQREF